MNAENILQSKLNKVKSFIDNESFVFTFSKTNAFAIHKDQLFKNQVYNTYIDHNGYEINERKNNPFIKNEKITQILNKNFLFNSSRISINDIGQNIVYEPKESEIEINSKKFKIKENISKIDSANGKMFYNDDNKIKSINISNLNNLTIHFEDKDEPFKPFKLYKSTIPFDVITSDRLICIDGDYYNSGTHNLENKKHIILCQDVESLKNVTINKGESLINYIVETSESESNFKFDRALENISGDTGYTELYNNEVDTIKVASIKKKCTSIEFRCYDLNDNRVDKIQFYIDGKLYTIFDHLSMDLDYKTINNLSNEEHEFTWVFFNLNRSYLIIDGISFDNEEIITDTNLFTNNYDNDIFGLKYISDEIKKNIINNIIKIEGLGFYKISKPNNEKKIYIYIDYYTYVEKYRCIIDIDNKVYYLERGINLIETEATDIYFELLCNKEILVSVLTDNHIYNKNELIKYNKEQASVLIYGDSFYKNGVNSSTPFYNDTVGVKIVSIKKTCTKMSFYYKTRHHENIILYIDGSYRDHYYTEATWKLASIDNLSNKEHEFTWVLYNDWYSYSCIDTISFDDVVETDSNLFSNTYDNELTKNIDPYKNGVNSSTPFYNDATYIKVASIKKTCTKMSFYYKTKNDDDSIFLYIDGNYYSGYHSYNDTWKLASIDNLSNKEHEFTWVLCQYSDSSNYYSCIDTISFDDVVETNSSLFSNTYDNELNGLYKNLDKSSTPFYIYSKYVKIVSIKKTCTKMSFYYKTRCLNDSIYLYIDGNYYNEYSNSNIWSLITVDNLSNKEHEFTWVLYNFYSDDFSCIDTISFDDVVETDSSLFSNTYDNELTKNINPYKNGDNSSTPFYNDTVGVKIVSIKKTCTKMSFYYKSTDINSYYRSYVYLYIDGKYYNLYINNTWSLITVDNLTNKEHEFTWVLYNYNGSYYSCIDTISFDDVVETDSSLFSNTYDNELTKNINPYKNGDKSSTPFYNNAEGVKIVSIKKTCTKMSFYYKINKNAGDESGIYLYIDGNYYSKYNSYTKYNTWSLDTIDNLSNKEHEFTWVLEISTTYKYNSTRTQLSIDTISFDDIVETDSSLFSNKSKLPLADISTDEKYKNGVNSSTPFYNDTIGFKIVSIKKTCTKMSFYYKIGNRYDNGIYLYIDGNYYSKYNSYTEDNTWSLDTIDNLSNKEHEFTWVLYNYYSDSHYSCIDTILFNDIVETDSSLFSNTYDNELTKNINLYKNGDKSSTPFYNDTKGVKIVSIKKTCTKMSFYYKTYACLVYFYIDGSYYNKYSTTDTWSLDTIDNLSNKEHEFTWVLCQYSDSSNYYSCIDTISFDDVVETDSNLFSNTYDNELTKNINPYKNGDKSSTPFYDDTVGVKIVSIKKTCTKMSFYYKSSDRYDSIYLYIDGSYYNEYSINDTWKLALIDNLSNKEHEFTWVLYSSCIDTISFDDVLETDSSLFSNTYDNELTNEFKDEKYKNGDNSSTPFYIYNTSIKIVSIKKTCTKMSFYYKTNNGFIYLYIDGNYYSKYNYYTENNTWKLASINNLSNKEHEFTWVLYIRKPSEYDFSCIDTISFDDVVETDSSLFSNTYDNELTKNINSYKNGDNSSTPFYNDNPYRTVKIVSIKKTCTKMSFYYKSSDRYNRIYLYIDGKYYNKYNNSDRAWTLITVDNLSNKEHEFTWVLYNDWYSYSCIDTISFDDVVETDSSLFSNTYDNELLNNNRTSEHFYFYNDATYIKVASIKKTCTKMSFYYKTSDNDDSIFLYIDGSYYSGYHSYNNTWELASIDNLSNKEHEFTWILYNTDDRRDYSCIDTILFDDVVETNSSLFSNNIESFIYKNENYIEVQNDNKIIDFCIFNYYFFIDSEYNLIRTDNNTIFASDVKKILNKQIVYYSYQIYDDYFEEWNDYYGNINVLFLLDKNNRLKIILDDSDLSDDLYYDGNFYEDIFEALEEVFKNKEIKDIICNKSTGNDSIETIYILTKNGEVYESTYGWNKDTDTIITPENTTVALKYDNIRFLAMKKTEYGIILLGEDGKLYVKGKFVNGEFGLYNTSSITIDGQEYSKAFVSDKLVRISRDEFLEDGEYKLRNIYTLKLYNTDAYDSGVYVVKEDGKLYYTGKNNGACGEVFGYPLEAQNIDVWTPVENNANDIGRISTPRPDYWSYYFDYIMKSDKNGSGNSMENIFFKIDDVWIDWNAYISKYMNVTLRDADNKILKKYKEFKKTDNSTLRKVINFDSFIEYLKLNKESITNEFKVDRTLIPQVDYIDKDLNVYTINAGDNISCIKYSQKDIDLLNADLIELLNHNIQLKNEYEDVIEKSQDPEEIFEYQNRLAVIELNIEELNKEIANNQDKLGTMNPNNYFDFNDNRIFNPMTVVGTEEKTIKYSKSNFSEPNENGEIEIETEEIDGTLHVVKSTVSKTVESNITKLKIDLINYDRLNNSSISDAEVLRDDIKMTIMEDPNDERNFEVDDLLVWLNGKFITKDYIIGNDNKAFCNYNGLAGVDTRRICEFPGYGEPTQNSNNIPTITGENATVIEPTVPTELRWDLSPKVFSWEDVKINGPYKIHDLNNVNSELRRVEFFYFGDVYCSVFTQFLIKNKICPKNTFILFFDGAVVPEDEYDVSIKGNNTYITLKKFTAYVTSLLQDEVDIMKPGYEGRVRHILSQFDNMSQFSIAFLSSTDKFKKVKMYYDYQTIRDVPKPGQVIFNDIKYNDLILFDGRYIPYLWESRHCIRIPETVNTIRTSENNFIRHSTICRARPYSTYKKESELTDTECRMYAKQNGLVNDEELSTLDITYIRERVKPHIEARIKEI